LRLLSYQQLRFAVDDTVNSYRELTESESKYSEGYMKLTDLNQVILNHRNTVSHYNEALKILKDSRKTLYFLMGIEDLSGSDFVLTDSLETLISRFSIDADYTEIDESLTEARLNALRDVEKIRLGNVKAGFIPEISLSGLYGSDFYNNRLILGDNNYWFGNSSVNLSMRIPLTEGIGRTRKIAQQKYLIDVKGEELTAAMNQKELEKDRAIQDIEFYRKEAGIKKSNLDLAKENYEASFSQFSEGRILQSELLQSELLLKQIKVDYLNAVYNYIDSLLNLRRIIES
jgi:outer membrane protein TolC